MNEQFTPSLLRRLTCTLDATDLTDLGGYSSGNLSAIGGGAPTVADSSGGGGWASGLTDLFSAATSAFTNVYRTVSPPRSGQLVLDPHSGQYIPAGTIVHTTGPLAGVNSNTLLLIGAGLLAMFLVLGNRRR